MTDKALRKQLEDLQRMKAQKSVHTFVETQIVLLSNKHSGWYFPLVTFRVGFVIAVLLLFVLATSGAVVAAAQSAPGTVFYPVKQILQHLPIIQSTVSTPTVIPDHAIKPMDMPTSTKVQGKKADQDKQPNKKNNNNAKTVKGIHTELNPTSQKQKKSIHLRPTLAQQQKTFHFSFDFFQHGKNQK